MSFKTKNRLTLTLILSVFLAIAVPVSATWFFAINSKEHDITAQMEINRNHMLNMLAVSLASPLWDLRGDKIMSICDQFLASPFIKRIKISDSILSQVVYDSTDATSISVRVIKGEKSIVANSKTIGSVYIEVSSLNYDKSIRDSKRLLLYLFLMELIISFILVTYAVYNFILYPLHAHTEKALSLSGKSANEKRNFFDLSLEKLNSKIVGVLGEFQKYHKIVDENVAILKIDEKGIVKHMTSMVTIVTGYEEDELIYCHASKLFNEVEELELMGLIHSGEAGIPFCILLHGETSLGVEYWLSCKVTLEADGAATLVCEDITSKKEIEKLANTDELTGLMNRRNINNILKKEEQIYARYKIPFSVLLIDIDFFKRVNDDYGHQAGDEILRRFAELIHKSIRETDYSARWGGEEFLLVCPSTTLENAHILGENIVKIVEVHSFPFVSQLTCSMGLCSSESGKSTDQMLLAADAALYRAKKLGRNRAEKA